MKWFTLIVTLIVAGGICYSLLFSKAPAGSPYATAEAFVEAATRNDAAKIRSLCVESAVASAEQAAAQLRSSSVDRRSITFKQMETDPPRRGLTAMFSGRVLAIEMVEENGAWKIILITVSG